ncbi:MAG: 8-oxoguanine glycosylase ogg1 [Claussenomyces sp. TS43310]|nr:MAG: 8-oxoguanine glycosylase ogg1 [Claussenomyces sp. TS43310]
MNTYRPICDHCRQPDLNAQVAEYIFWQVNNLCVHYGPLIGHIDSVAFHDFPCPEALAAHGLESHLRKLGFGYRARYLAQTAMTVAREKPVDWLQSMANGTLDCMEDSKGGRPNGRPGYRHAHEQLLQLQGVGPKVADCVCLMGLGWGEAVPVDTHVWQIAQRDYKFGKAKHRSLTKRTYDAIGDNFRSLWGMEAGWAHSVLFAADLRTFAIRATTKSEMYVEEIARKQVDCQASDHETVVVKRKPAEDNIKEEPVNEHEEVVHITTKRKLKNKK